MQGDAARCVLGFLPLSGADFDIHLSSETSPWPDTALGGSRARVAAFERDGGATLRKPVTLVDRAIALCNLRGPDYNPGYEPARAGSTWTVCQMDEKKGFYRSVSERVYLLPLLPEVRLEPARGRVPEKQTRRTSESFI
ncbi:hypothetical protein NDU88_009229 [Pleurodeles waltl]|uniref:Uncharacterized protein n=1 Tax=Pleurodeles waltl TaxID=8319 RepID=A0AAV7QQY6_PLEWA|nr:hypothetical protein NDU88_009229 [Pleurodeles waltl]